MYNLDRRQWFMPKDAQGRITFCLILNLNNYEAVETATALLKQKAR